MICSFICSGIQLLESLCALLEAMKVSFIAPSGLPTSLAALLHPQVNDIYQKPCLWWMVASLSPEGGTVYLRFREESIPTWTLQTISFFLSLWTGISQACFQPFALTRALLVRWEVRDRVRTLTSDLTEFGNSESVVDCGTSGWSDDFSHQ